MKLSKSKQILSKGNIFAFNPEFNVNGEKGYHSLFSFSLSFIFYTMFLLMVIYFSQDWFLQQNPQVSFTYKSFDDKEEVSLDEILGKISIIRKYILDKDAYDILKQANLTENTFFTLSINIGHYNYTEGKYDFFYILMVYLSSEISGQNIEINSFKDSSSIFAVNDYRNEIYKVHNSNLSDFKLELKKDYHIDLSYENILFDKTKELNFRISQDYSYFSYFPKTFFFDIDKENGFSKGIDMFENDDPFSHDVTTEKDRKNLDEYLTVRLNFLEVEDNRGDLLNKITKERKFEAKLYEKYKYPSYLLNIEMQRKMTVFKRNYKKLQNVFADVGGILTSLITILKFISDIFNVRFFNYEVINLLFENDLNTEIRNNINKIYKLEDINKDIQNLQKNNKSRIDASSNRDLIIRKLEKPKQIERCVSMPFEEVKYNSIIENSNNNINNINNNIDNLNNNNDIPNPNNDCEKERIKKEIEKLKEEHLIKRGNKMFFKKDQEKNFINMTNKEFFKLLIPFNKCKNKEQFQKEEIFNIAEEKISQYLNVFNFFDLQEDFEKIKLILLDKYQNCFFDFIKKRTFKEISGEKYIETVLESIFYYKENKDNIGFIDGRILDNIDSLLKKMMN